jgi:glutamate 5-kinase
VVDLKNLQGKLVARGVSNYAIGEVIKLYKTPSSKINEILGYQGESEIIHRDNLVLLKVG